ncbi:MAG: adenylate/guanylate cyclase domain-containing protein [Verrucomicrobiota bacterium]
MQSKFSKLAPIAITGGVIGLVLLIQALPHLLPGFDIFQRLEWMTYDWRVRQANKFSPPTTADNLGFVFADDDTVERLGNGLLEESYGLLWPRQIYGRLVRELSAEGVKAIGFDVLFGELRPDHPPIKMPDNTLLGSDQFFAEQIKLAGNVVLAAEKELFPTTLFQTNAWASADISVEKDADGISRRVKAFNDYRNWNPLFKSLSRQHHLNLVLAPDKVIFVDPDNRETELEVSIDRDGYFQLEDLTGKTNSAGFKVLRKAYTDVRVWHMGIVLAARELSLDLEKSMIDLDRHRISLVGVDGQVKRIIPVDNEGRFLVDWSLAISDKRLTKSNFEDLLLTDQDRVDGRLEGLTNRWRNKIAVIGSAATGSNLTDLTATPLENKTRAVGTYWNVANSVITGHFVRQYTYAIELLEILLLGIASGVLSWKLRAPWTSVWVAILSVGFFFFSLYVYLHYRYWLPIILPVAGAMLMTHVCSVAYQVLLEQNERRRVKSVFAKIVSPDVVNELLSVEKLPLVGARRKVTVFFADIRGFTEMTDMNQAKAEQYVKEYRLTGEQADAYFEQQARQTLRTVNAYLAIIADTIKLHKGTLDKYIGDCVMAFWGAPIPNEKHALGCVRAAIDAQRAIDALNHERSAENEHREKENGMRSANGQPPVPIVPLLSLGTGINTGIVTVGLMGSDAHLLNYTVFGREVNLASRLEGASGRDRIFIGEATYVELARDAPDLAAACVEREPILVKGFRNAVKMYEVSWKQINSPIK